MKIIEQSYEIISLPENLLQTLEMAGRTCYKSEDKIGCTIKDNNYPDFCAEFGEDDFDPKCEGIDCPKHSSFQFVKMLINRGHHAMLEFADITVRFITDRGVTHEMVRHRLCNFAQESTRYVKYDGEMEFIKPVWFIGKLGVIGNWDQRVWKNAMLKAECYYKSLLNSGWQPQQARSVLPNSLKTEIVVKANIREWRHIFTLRCSKKAHPQMHELMRPLLDELKEKIPVVFEDINY